MCSFLSSAMLAPSLSHGWGHALTRQTPGPPLHRAPGTVCVCARVRASSTCKALRAEVWSRCALDVGAAPRQPQGAPGPQSAGLAWGLVYPSMLQRVRADRHVTGWAFLSVSAWWACPQCTSQTQGQVLPALFLSPVGPEARLAKGPISAVLI